jgi:hypothetical protein
VPYPDSGRVIVLEHGALGLNKALLQVAFDELAAAGAIKRAPAVSPRPAAPERCPVNRIVELSL